MLSSTLSFAMHGVSLPILKSSHQSPHPPFKVLSPKGALSRELEDSTNFSLQTVGATVRQLGRQQTAQLSRRQRIDSSEEEEAERRN
jgi:hypothetical protein